MRILLVDDDAKLARALAKGLRSHAYAVDVAADADAALTRAAVYDYDLMLLDVMLPGRDGFVVCAALREHGVAAPVLMLTARDSEPPICGDCVEALAGCGRRAACPADGCPLVEAQWGGRPA